MSRPSDDFHVYDTTLRDGAQREGISYSVADKLKVAKLLDGYGVGFIEGGWPGALPKDTEFFARAREEIDFKHAQLVAFGATRKAGVAPTYRRVSHRPRCNHAPEPTSITVTSWGIRRSSTAELRMCRSQSRSTSRGPMSPRSSPAVARRAS